MMDVEKFSWIFCSLILLAKNNFVNDYKNELKSTLDPQNVSLLKRIWHINYDIREV